jgi:hypothetical protein
VGAWGPGAFENDDSSDWVWELEDDTDASVVTEALSAIVDLDADDYIEAPEACNAIAAAEIVAAARGHQGVELPSEARAWIDRNAQLVDPSLLALAVVAVERISIDSELKELWDDAGNTEWARLTAELLERLRSA